VGFGSRVHDTTEGVLGFLPVLLLPAARRRALDSKVNRQWVPSTRGNTGSASGGTEADSGVPEGDNETSEVDEHR
jgi:hypothetical protein